MNKTNQPNEDAASEPAQDQVASTVLVGRWRLTMDGEARYRLHRRKWMIWREIGRATLFGWEPGKWKTADEAWEVARQIESCEKLIKECHGK